MTIKKAYSILMRTRDFWYSMLCPSRAKTVHENITPDNPPDNFFFHLIDDKLTAGCGIVAVEEFLLLMKT